MLADDPLDGVIDGLAGARRLAEPSRDLVAMAISQVPSSCRWPVCRNS
jgi:hypothetical protein